MIFSHLIFQIFIIDDLALAVAGGMAIISAGLPIIAAAGAAIGIYNLGSNALNAYEIELLKAEDELIKTTMMMQDSLYREALIQIETTRSQDMQNISQENLFRDSIISDNQIKIESLIQQDLINQFNIQSNYDMNIMNNESIQNLGLYDQLLNQNDIDLFGQTNLLIQNYETAIPNIQTNLQSVNDNLTIKIDEGSIYNATQFLRIDNINTDQEYRINILENQAQENPIMKEEDLRIILNQTVTQPLLEQVPIQTTDLLKPELSQLEIQVQNHQQQLTKQIEDQQNATFGRFDTFNQELSNFANTVPIATNEILHPSFVRINTDLANQNARIINIPSTTIDLIDPKINTITENTQNIQGELATINQNIANTDNNRALETAGIIGAIGVVGAGVAMNRDILNGLSTSVSNLGTQMSNLFRKLGIDRMLNMLNTGLLLHNAMMLSNNLAQSLLYIIDNVINFIGFQATDAEGNVITASQVLGGTIQNFIIGMIGEEAYINARIELNKANRIYQAATNVAYTVVSFADIIKEISEIIVENTGKIGNALRRSGAVLENSYNIMPERNGIKTAMQKKLERFNEGLQELTEGAETFVELTELLVEGKENIRELTTGMGEFDKSLQEQEAEKEAERLQLITEARSYTDITSVNFVKQPPEGI
jgi:hypothetical protein